MTSLDGISLIVLIAVFVMAIIALNKNSKLEVKIAQLSLKLNGLVEEVGALRRKLAEAESEIAPARRAKPTKAAALETPATRRAVAETRSPELKTEVAGPEARVSEPAPATSKAWQTGKQSPPAGVPTPPPRAPARDMEQALASRWFVWIGGLAIAIGGVLFVKYAFDAGWISPLLRCVLGFIFGLLLIAGGEYLRRTPLLREEQSYVPAALTAAGLVIAFGSVYAAYALYELITPMVAFAIMAAIAIAAFVLSMVQGPLIAALGLLGSYATPTLIPSEDPSAWAFFPYLLIILAAALAILRRRAWWWLGYAAVAGSLIWGLLWAHGGVYENADALPLGLFALALGAGAFLGIAGRDIVLANSGSLVDVNSIGPPLGIGITGLVAGGLILCANVFASSHAFTALLLLIAGSVGLIAVAWLKDGMTALTIGMAVLVLLTVGAWHEGNFTELAYDELGQAVVLLGPGASRFLAWLAIFGILFAGSGYAGTRLKAEPVPWAGLAAGAAIAYGFVGAGRAYGVLSSAQWILVATVVTAVFCAAIWSLRARLEEPMLNLSLGLFAIAATCAAAFGLQEQFERVWLSIALAVLVPILALAAQRIRIELLGPIATVTAGVVAVRLFVAHDLWFGDSSLPLGNHWPIYGYGVPILLFWISSRVFNGAGYEKAMVALESAALGLVIALVSLELRVFIAGSVRGEEPGLLEIAANVVAWYGGAYGLMHRQAAFSGLVSLWGARLLMAAATGLAVFGNLVVLNPVVTGDAVAGSTFFNALLLAYLAPAILGVFIARRLSVLNWEAMRPTAGVLALILLLAYLTLQTKRYFQGPEMVPWAESDAENYAYSAVWLLSALALFVAGIRLGLKHVRMAGLVVMSAVVLKVFLFDLSGIGGLYRIASFVGLGLCLVGIGWLYTRYVQKSGTQSA